MNEGFAIALTHLEDEVPVYRSIASGTFFCNTKNPMIRRNQHAFIGGNKTTTDHSPRLGNFRGHRYIDISLRWKQ